MKKKKAYKQIHFSDFYENAQLKVKPHAKSSGLFENTV